MSRSAQAGKNTHAGYISHILFPSGYLGQSPLLQNEYLQNSNE